MKLSKKVSFYFKIIRFIDKYQFLPCIFLLGLDSDFYLKNELYMIYTAHNKLFIKANMKVVSE